MKRIFFIGSGLGSQSKNFDGGIIKLSAFACFDGLLSTFCWEMGICQ